MFICAMNGESEDTTSYSSACSLSSMFKDEYDMEETKAQIESIEKQLHRKELAIIVFIIVQKENSAVSDVVETINHYDEIITLKKETIHSLAILQSFASGYGERYLDWFYEDGNELSIANNKKYEKQYGITESQAGYYLAAMSNVFEDCAMNVDGLPLDRPYTITGYFPTYSKDGSGGTHYGIDFGVAMGTPLYAIADSEVVLASQTCDEIGYLGSTCGGYGITGGGNYVILKISNGEDYYMVSYSHMKSVYVNKGDHIVKGQTIGISGSSGNSTGPHMHFEIHKNESAYQLGNDKGVIDPCEFVAGLCE